MITQDNLSSLLDQLGFTQSGQKYSKTIGDATLTVDRKKKRNFLPGSAGYGNTPSHHMQSWR